MTYKILVLDDEKMILETVQSALELNGFEVTAFTDSRLAYEDLQKNHYDLALLDVMVPYMDGFQLAKELRAIEIEIPIIFLTARDQPQNKIEGFDSGADDYIVKPYNLEELIARVNAVLKRHKQAPTTTQKDVEDPILKFKDLEINFDTVTVKRGDEEINLSPTEFDLLVTLVKNHDIVLSKNQLRAQVWQDETIELGVVDVYISYLRKKIDNFKDKEKLIHTKWGVGICIK